MRILYPKIHKLKKKRVLKYKIKGVIINNEKDGSALSPESISGGGVLCTMRKMTWYMHQLLLRH